MTLLDTAIRETFEEIGVDLRNNELFQLVGRVDDHLAQGNMPVSCFIYLWKDLSKVSYNLNASEVDAMRWFPLENFIATGSREQRLRTTQLDKYGNVTNTSVLKFTIGLVYPKFKQLLDQLHLKDVDTCFPCIEISSYSINGNEFERPELEFILWGLTLRILSSFLQIIDQSLPLMNYHYDFENEILDWMRRNYSNLNSYLTLHYKTFNSCENSNLPLNSPAPNQNSSKQLLFERLSKL